VKDEAFKTTVIFGQDELAFHQLMLKPKNWAGPDGEQALLPKSDGIVVMTSAFASRDTGLGLETDAAMLRRINLSRRGQKHANEHAAKDIFNAAEKKDMEESPFVKHFELGAQTMKVVGCVTTWHCSQRTVQTASRQPVRMSTLCSCSITAVVTQKRDMVAWMQPT
jgi:hypothetical protein